jgi:hypothetical protein
MAVATAVATVGLADLDDLTGFLVRQEVEPLEVASGIETENSYVVLGAADGRARFQLLAVEQSNLLARMVLGRWV